MDRVNRYLEVVPLPVLMVAPILAIAAFLLVPARWRLPAALAFQMVWLVLSEMPGLGFPQRISKATGFAGFGLVALAAWLDPGPKRHFPHIGWAYIATALLGFVFIWTLSDVGFAFVIRLQWLIMVIAAIGVARTIVDQESLLRVATGLAVGMAIGVFVPFSDLLLHPASAFKYGLRFSPYESNANHTGILFALTVPMAAYAAVRTDGFKRLAFLAVAAMAGGMGLLTASRSTLAVMAITTAPVALAVTRQPGLLVGLGVLVIGILAVMFKFLAPSTVAVDRLATLDTARVEQGRQYLQVIAERPWFGLLGTDGANYVAEAEIQAHAHNGYLETLYQGGLVYAIPVFAIVGWTFFNTFRFWKDRKSVGADPMLVNVMIAMMVMTYAHGFVNHALFWPTTTLSFFHVTLSTLMACWAGDLRMGEDPIPAGTWDHHGDGEDDDGGEAHGEYDQYADYGDSGDGDGGDGGRRGGAHLEVA